MHSSGRGDFAGNLEEVPFPPGGTTTWATACRTRSQTDGYYVHKIPLSYSLLSTSQGSNNVGAFTAAGATYLINSASGAVYGLAADGPVAISANGQEHYPVYNNNAQITAEKCEVDSCNQHVGQGGGPAHLHGDPFGTYCMYSNASYVDSVNGHPPQTGWSFDGPSIYGRYLSTTALGQSVPLDDCGGHAHGSYEYHYHAQVTTETTSSGIPSNFGVAAGQSYPSFSGGVYKCYKADISVGAQPYFFVSDKTNQALYQPCCSGTQKYVAAGITLATTASSPQPAPSGCSASKTLAAWLITVIVVSSVVFVALVAFAVWWFKFRVASDSVVDASVSGNDMEMSEKRQETA